MSSLPAWPSARRCGDGRWIRADASKSLQAQQHPRVVEPAVHPELRHPAAVDEAAEADVSRDHLPVRVGVQDIVAADRDPKATPQLVGQVEVEQCLRAEVLVARRAGWAVVLDRAVIGRACEPREATESVSSGERALLAGQRVLEPVAVFSVQNAVPNARKI